MIVRIPNFIARNYHRFVFWYALRVAAENRRLKQRIRELEAPRIHER